VVVAGDEPHAPYERPPLSKELLLGTRTASSLGQRPEGYHDGLEIVVATSGPVRDVDLGARRALVGDRVVRWRRLVLATGARPRMLPGMLLGGVHVLRSLDDALGLSAEMVPGARLVVVGAGFVGAEVASAAVALGLDVTVVEAASHPMAQVLGAEAGSRLAARMRAGGVVLRTGAAVAGLRAAGGRATAVALRDGTVLPCDLVLVAIGAVPGADVPGCEALGRAGDGGIPTDPCGRTSHPAVWACGDVASAWRPRIGRHRGRGHWTSAARSARAAAHAIVGRDDTAGDEAFVWSDQFGWRIQVVGEAGGDLCAEVAEEDEAGLVIRYRDGGGRLRGGLAAGRPEALAAIRAELAVLADVSAGVR
ncbi:MAG: NAD(P)/FAD-dependent oxidoreductase, partial [Thermoleophilia bacterium]